MKGVSIDAVFGLMERPLDGDGGQLCRASEHLFARRIYLTSKQHGD
ncbi:hypothetical protein [Bradyrhizobium cosmicum]|nr:hypothetical protein [Bradyrhizobium cosmicum]